MSRTSSILITLPTADYELLDSGLGEKLERFGSVILSRPDPQALWRKRLSPSEWKKADGYFTREESGGGWTLKKDIPNLWDIAFYDLKFRIKPTAFKHVGLFPEQAGNWSWMKKRIQDSIVTGGKVGNVILGADGQRQNNITERADGQANIEILNLFGYTGGATLACAQAGAKVVHVDGSKTAIAWARANGELSGLSGAPIRWILDDVRDFVKREIKRDRKYDAIIMDPPAFGHGPENELWKIEEDFLPLVLECLKLLTSKPLFFLINGYSAGYSAIAYENILLSLKEKFGGSIEIGELTIAESNSERLLPCGIFSRWNPAHK